LASIYPDQSKALPLFGQEKAEYPVYSPEEVGCLCIYLPLAVLWGVKEDILSL